LLRQPNLLLSAYAATNSATTTRPSHNPFQPPITTTTTPATLKREIEALSGATPPARIRPERIREMQSLMRAASERLTMNFREVSSAEFVERIDLVVGEIGALELTLRVTTVSGTSASPHQIFSEANLDLCALLVFLSIAQEAAERGQARLLVLDDVLQSVDSGFRVKLMRLLVREFSDWQLVVTAHDRLWREQLRSLLTKSGKAPIEIEILGWDLESGPRIRGGEPGLPLDLALDSAEPTLICAAAGRQLEQVCDELSWRLPTSVQRRRGDAYTLGDLWPGVHRKLMKSGVSGLADDVDTWLHLRNMVGAHYNEWADAVCLSEAEELGIAVRALYQHTYCLDCARWVERAGQAMSCRCGHTSFDCP